jgi:type I restriction enzyme S subunit
MIASDLKKSIIKSALSGKLITTDQKNWISGNFGDYFKIKSGIMLSMKDFKEGKYPVYGGNGIMGYHNDYNCGENKIIIGRVGAYCGSIHITKSKSWVTDNAFVTSYDSSNFTIRFLLYLFEYLNLRSFANKSAQPVISGKKINPIQIFFPSVFEQERIVEKLEEILPLIESLEKDEIKLKDLMQHFPESMKASILQAAIQGKITEQNIADGDTNKYYKEEMKLDIVDYPFEIPDNWTFVKMKHLVSIQTGKKDANFGTSNGKYDFFTCALEPIKAPSYSYEGESILLPGNGANVGVAIYYNGRFEAYQRTYILQKIDENISIKYLYYHLMANWKSFNKEKQYGSAIPYIKMGNLTEYPVALPPKNEQIAIVKKIEETLPFVETLNHV